MSSTSVLPWWIFVLQGSDWISHRKFILDESSVMFCLFMTLLDGILSSGQLKIPALRLTIDLSFLLGSFKLNLNDELSLNKKLTSHLVKGEKTPTIMGGIYMFNTRVWSFKFKGSSMLGMVKSY